ncbi:O-methyltransferase [Mangrovibacillus cuniculi]|uniref:Methyltransferase domain-containing protein n=1 Tax=Mangrovibacillus cuniculi TaxID=2593652 RepID=A0A7S8C9K4_9BACI|nr:class I SAM-dependent methyltransferase [Mangrovibacillus cuniculi]QPC45882.1 methyltransferase domain-containing protein [Mangrovibacillus cuniculi]
MTTMYRYNSYLPEIVMNSKKLAKSKHFSHSCSDETGRLLSVLVGQIKHGKILEIGTGYGVGSSWIVSALLPGVSFYSVDHDKKKVDLVRETLHHCQVTFLVSDWKELIHKGPFQFIFADAAAAKCLEAELLLCALDIGGLLLMDDFTPQEHFPEEWRDKPDEVREFWLNHEDVRATEIYLSPTSAALLVTRIN